MHADIRSHFGRTSDATAVPPGADGSPVGNAARLIRRMSTLMTPRGSPRSSEPSPLQSAARLSLMTPRTSVSEEGPETGFAVDATFHHSPDGDTVLTPLTPRPDLAKYRSHRSSSDGGGVPDLDLRQNWAQWGARRLRNEGNTTGTEAPRAAMGDIGTESKDRFLQELCSLPDPKQGGKEQGVDTHPWSRWGATKVEEAVDRTSSEVTQTVRWNVLDVSLQDPVYGVLPEKHQG